MQIKPIRLARLPKGKSGVLREPKDCVYLEVPTKPIRLARLTDAYKKYKRTTAIKQSHKHINPKQKPTYSIVNATNYERDQGNPHLNHTH